VTTDEVRPAAAGTLPDSQTANPQRWLTLLVLSLAQLMDVLDGTIINIALPSAQSDLGFDLENREWLVTGYALAYGSLLLFGGRLADRFGRQRLLYIGLVGFAVSSAVAGAATSFEVLLGARIAQGLFAAALAPAALSLVSVTFADDPAERGRAFAVFGAVSGMGGAIGLTLGGVLTDELSWRWCLYINVAIAALALVGAVAFVRDADVTSTEAVKAASTRTVDLPGVVLVVAGLAGVVFGLGNSAAHGWDAPSTWVPVTMGALLVVGFVYREARTAYPLLPMSVVLDRNRGAAFLAIAISGVGAFAIFLYLSYYLQQTLGFSATEAGFSFLPFAGVLILGAGVSGSVLLPRFGPRPIIPTGGMFAAGALLLLTRIDQDTSFATGVLPSVLLFGFGTGLIFGSAQNVATYGVDSDSSGVASAMVNTMQQVGGSIGLALFTYISAAAVDRYIADSVGQPDQQLQTLAALSSYHTVFWAAAAIFLAGAALTAALFRPGPGVVEQASAPR
jgi:EmrB/QacA subfamily drug resistance transporter